MRSPLVEGTETCIVSAEEGEPLRPGFGFVVGVPCRDTSKDDRRPIILDHSAWDRIISAWDRARSIMRISSLEFGLLLGGEVWLLPFYSASRVYYKRWTRRHFLELLLLSRTVTKLQLQSVSLRQLQYWKDYKAQSIYKTIHLPQYSSALSINESSIHLEI